jgi:hypothetical protein
MEDAPDGQLHAWYSERQYQISRDREIYMMDHVRNRFWTMTVKGFSQYKRVADGRVVRVTDASKKAKDVQTWPDTNYIGLVFENNDAV